MERILREDSDIDAASSPARGAAEANGMPSAPSSGTDTMSITFKLYATLQDLLPAGAVRNAITIDVARDASLNDIIDRYRVPRTLAHLVLINGVFVCDAEREARGRLNPGDTLAIWPPVAGG